MDKICPEYLKSLDVVGLDASLERCSGHDHLGENPRAEPGHTGEIILHLLPVLGTTLDPPG